MARNRKQTTTEVATNTVVASAARYGGKIGVDFTKIAQGTEWHESAWFFYDIIGEFRYSCDWVGAQLSKALLHATIEKNGVVSRVEEKAGEFVYRLFGDSDGRAEMLRLIGIHMTVTGECWIVGWPDEKDDGDFRDEWQVVASNSLKRRGVNSGAWLIDNEEIKSSSGEAIDEEQIMAIRLWRPHPKHPLRSNSPTRAILPILGEIYGLTQHVAAQVDSRLAGAGILLMPTEMQFPAPPAQEGEVQRTANNAEDLMGILQEAMQASIKNRDDASALVPIVITAPAEAISAVKHMTFWTELDEKAIELRNEAIRRLALGMDMPPEVLQGISESNHWSAWQADESAIKSHTEPLLKIITTALARGYLRPLLVDEGMGHESESYSIGVDTSEMRLRPNRSKEAMELFDRGALSVAALRRETGFSEEDKMDPEEFALWTLKKLADGSSTPEMMNAALRKLGINLDIPAAEGVEPEVVREARPSPSLKEHPETGTPDQQRSENRKDARQQGRVPSATDVQHAALVAGSEQIVLRALERSGNKLKNRMQASTSVAAVNLYRIAAHTSGDYDNLLADAWSHVPALAQRYGVSALRLEESLDTYCRGLFATKKAHTFDAFAAHMDASMELIGASA